MRKIALISAILETPEETQTQFNQIIAQYRDIIKGRMGLPFDEMQIAVIAITVIAEMDKINAFTGKLGKLPNVIVKTSVSSKNV